MARAPGKQWLTQGTPAGPGAEGAAKRAKAMADLKALEPGVAQHVKVITDLHASIISSLQDPKATVAQLSTLTRTAKLRLAKG